MTGRSEGKTGRVVTFVAQHSDREMKFRFRILAITICPDRVAVISKEVEGSGKEGAAGRPRWRM
jgi:hypothetical protein